MAWASAQAPVTMSSPALTQRAAPPRAPTSPRPSASPATGMPASKTPKMMPTLRRVRALAPETPMPIAAAKFDRPSDKATRIRAGTRSAYLPSAPIPLAHGLPARARAFARPRAWPGSRVGPPVPADRAGVAGGVHAGRGDHRDLVRVSGAAGGCLAHAVGRRGDRRGAVGDGAGRPAPLGEVDLRLEARGDLVRRRQRDHLAGGGRDRHRRGDRPP